MMMKLITIVFSHYNERARWALDRYCAPYEEAAYLPNFHIPAVAYALHKGGGAPRSDKASSRLSTPVLVREDGMCICDSGEIARYVADRFAADDDAHLYPAEHTEAIAAMEQDLHDRLGPHTRMLAYHFLFQHPEVLDTLAQRNVGRAQATLFRMAKPLLVRKLPKLLGITPEAAERSRRRIEEVMATYSERLEGRAYLVGDRFTAADLTLACMAMPMLGVTREDGIGPWLPAASEVPAEMREFVEGVRATRAGAFAVRMFQEHRRERV